MEIPPHKLIVTKKEYQTHIEALSVKLEIQVFSFELFHL